MFSDPRPSRPEQSRERILDAAAYAGARSIERIRGRIGKLTGQSMSRLRALPAGSRPGAAVAIAGSMMGGMQMARMFEGARSGAVLRDCLDALVAQYEAPS